MLQKTKGTSIMLNNLKKLLITCLFLTNSTIFGAIAPPALTPHDTYSKTEEILRKHAKYKVVDASLMERIFKVFVDKLDPIKVYLLDNEIDKYKNPSEKLLNRAVKNYFSKDFSDFMDLYAIFLKSIDRRGNLESAISSLDLPQNVNYEDIEKMDHPTSIEEAKSKLLLIKGLQEEAILQLEEENREKQRLFIQKKRKNMEKEFIASSGLERKRMVHAFFLKSVAEALDSHTVYFTPHEAKHFLVHLQRRVFGIGAMLTESYDGILVAKILKGGPAERNKSLKKGDKIIAVEGKSVIGMDLNEAVELIRGPKKTKVSLSIIRTVDEKKVKHSVDIIRDEIVFEESRYTAKTEPYGDGVIAHLHLHCFYEDPKTSSSKDLKKELLKIKENHKLKGVVLDLRSNGGGLLTEAINVASLFIDKGVVAAIRTHTGEVSRIRNLSDNKVWDGPLVVLTNKLAASASEIVSLSLSDYGRAIIVGDTRTYGKGTYQTGSFFDSSAERINPKGEYSVTGGVYYTVGGKSPQLTGVLSDIVVPGVYAKSDHGEKHTKYPLENNSITPLFNDDLSDIHPLYKYKIRKMLSNKLQKRESVQHFIARLSKSSNERIENNKDYQNFLEALNNPKDSTYVDELFSQEDLQLSECMNIMKEFILLHDKEE